MHPLIYVPRQRLWVPSDLGDTPPRGRGNCDGTIAGAGAGAGFGGSRWTPASVPGCLLWQGSYRDDRATLNTRPTLANSDFEAGDVGWTKGAGWSIGGGVATRAAGSASSLTQALVLLPGNRYSHSWAVSRIAAGLFGTGWYSGSPNRTTVGTWTEEGTATATTFSIAANAAADGDVDNVLGLSNLSLREYRPAYVAPAYAGTVLQQATATAMPWRSTDGLGIRYQGGDLLAWSAAAAASKCLHDGTGGTLIVCWRPTALAASTRIAATAALNVANKGVNLSATNGNKVRVYVMNGGAGYDYDSGDVACTVSNGSWYVSALRVAAGAGGVDLRVNGVQKITGALTAPSADAPTTGLMLGAEAAGSASSLDGVIGDYWLANRSATDAEVDQIGRSMILSCSGSPASW